MAEEPTQPPEQPAAPQAPTTPPLEPAPTPEPSQAPASTGQGGPPPSQDPQVEAPKSGFFKGPVKIILIVLVVKLLLGVLVYAGYKYVLPNFQKEEPATVQDVLGDVDNPFNDETTFSNPFDESSIDDTDYQNPFDEF